MEREAEVREQLETTQMAAAKEIRDCEQTTGNHSVDGRLECTHWNKQARENRNGNIALRTFQERDCHH